MDVHLTFRLLKLLIVSLLFGSSDIKARFIFLLILNLIALNFLFDTTVNIFTTDHRGHLLSIFLYHEHRRLDL